MKVNMIKFVSKSSFFIILILIISYFFVGLFNFHDKILSLEMNKNIVNSNIVILTGGSNRIKEGLKIVNNINKLTKTDFKILISGTGKGFTKATLKKILTSDFNLKLVECCIELESISKDTYSNASETYKWTKKNDINNLFKKNIINFHGTRLPIDSGGGPLSWRILRNDRIGMQLAHVVSDKIDKGDILKSKKYLFPNWCKLPF